MRVSYGRWALGCVLFLLAACGERVAVPFQHHVYVWQRQWQPEHAAALQLSRRDFAQLRVLAGQLHPRSGWSRARVDLPLLVRDGRPVIAVIRLDGQLPQLDTPAIATHVSALLERWRAAGVPLRGIEVDHDCAVARLAAYAGLLRTLRAEVPSELTVSITALPSWLGAPELEAVLAAVDSSVLQVHAVERTQAGLMDSVQALHWIERYSELRRRFYVSLPAYGMGLVKDAAGRTRVESEVTLPIAGARHELRVEPAVMSDFLRELRARAVPGLDGLVWFRLPLPDDQRAWPLATLQAVVRGDSLDSQLRLTVAQQGVLHDLALLNTGNAGSALPQLIEVPASDCTAADGGGDYRIEAAASQLVLRRVRAGQLSAGREQAVGWARCGEIKAGEMRVTQ